jgi:hypothetical protein
MALAWPVFHKRKLTLPEHLTDEREGNMVMRTMNTTMTLTEAIVFELLQGDEHGSRGESIAGTSDDYH